MRLLKRLSGRIIPDLTQSGDGGGFRITRLCKMAKAHYAPPDHDIR